MGLILVLYVNVIVVGLMFCGGLLTMGVGVFLTLLPALGMLLLLLGCLAGT